jgi:hypothetical protein
MTTDVFSPENMSMHLLERILRDDVADVMAYDENDYS